MKKQKIIKKIHFVGIGGVSVSSLAIWALQHNYMVTGSDSTMSNLTKKLQDMGIKVFCGHNEQNVKNADLVVYSNATENSIEVKFARQNNIKCLSRAELLGQILKDYDCPICVSGAHGKTTTTALIYNVLKCAGKLPSLHLGGNLCETGKSYCFANKQYMVCEACEYKDSFLHLPANIGVILNIAPEHLDYFKTYNNVVKSFNQFASNSQNLVINYDFFNKNAVFFDNFAFKNKKVLTFGITNGNFTATNIMQNLDGTYTFDCLKNNKFYAKIHLNLIGKHNILNALATIAVCYLLKIAKSDICAGLQSFKGVERRFEYLSKSKFIVHDYAHHPDEISAVISETLKFYKDKLLVVFQPHTYSRTKLLMKDFIKCFDSVKQILVLKTYSAREKYQSAGSAKTLAKRLKDKAKYIRSYSQAKEYILKMVQQGYGVLYLGAGDIYSFAKIVTKLC